MNLESFNESLQGNGNLKVLFFGWIGNFNPPKKSLCYEQQSDHIVVVLYKMGKEYKVRIGCYTTNYEDFKKILHSKDLLKTTTRYFKIYHKKHENKKLYEQEIRALSGHHSRYYKDLEIIFEKLIEDDRKLSIKST